MTNEQFVAASNRLETITTVAQNGNRRPARNSTNSSLSPLQEQNPKMPKTYRYTERRLRVEEFDCQLPEEARPELGAKPTVPFGESRNRARGGGTVPDAWGGDQSVEPAEG